MPCQVNDFSTPCQQEQNQSPSKCQLTSQDPVKPKEDQKTDKDHSDVREHAGDGQVMLKNVIGNVHVALLATSQIVPIVKNSHELIMILVFWSPQSIRTCSSSVLALPLTTTAVC